MAKLERITEPDENLVHYKPAPMADGVTLCGLTDFLGHRKAGKNTRKAVTCNLCIATVRYIQAADKEPTHGDD